MGRPLKEPEKIIEIKTEDRVNLDAELMEGFVRTFLLEGFDGGTDIPEFHKEMWRLWCDPYKYVAVAAPRGHAKSTACNMAFSLAAMLFGFRDFEVIISATEDLAVKHLKEIKVQLQENEMIVDTFGVSKFLKDNDAELVCKVGNRLFCILAKGAEQKLRGIKWRGKRPNLVVIDDLEEDEQVLSQERREKLKNWFMSALLPMGNRQTLFRMMGTILHSDSLLEGILKKEMWKSRRYKAHESYDDFSNILWPEMFPEEFWRMTKKDFSEEGKASKYSQEYLNIPVAEEDQYFKREWFKGMDGDEGRMRNYATIDLAISQKDHANKTSITVGGVDSEGILNIIYNCAGKWDSLDIIDNMFLVHEMFEPEVFLIEQGHIEKALGPFLNQAMIERGIFLNIQTFRPDKDKQTRARSFQARMRAGGVRFDVDADWYEDLFQEMMTFPRGQHDDRVDSTTALGLLLEDMMPAETEEEIWEAEMLAEELLEGIKQGRCKTTGY